MSISRRNVLVLGAAAVAASTLPARAEQARIYSDGGAAINGYDPVAYFKQNEPVKGDAAFSSDWKGAKWLFSSAENKASFDADPERFAPQYGGYCAYAVSRGYTASTDPDAWTVYENKLYLNYNKAVRLLWSRDIPGHIASADENWPGVLQ